MTCLICNSLLDTITWSTIFTLHEKSTLCNKCQSQLSPINNNKKCHYCYKRSTMERCSDCIMWEKHYKGKKPLIKNSSLYYYNDFTKKIISRWKFRSDLVLLNIFSQMIKKEFFNHFHTLDDPLIVPIPLSKERYNERGFNQATAIASLITSDPDNIIKRTHAEKRAKKSRIERLQQENPFICSVFVNKPVILIDDIYTTGSTIYQAADILKNHGCPEIYSFTLIRG